MTPSPQGVLAGGAQIPELPCMERAQSQHCPGCGEAVPLQLGMPQNKGSGRAALAPHRVALSRDNDPLFSLKDAWDFTS